MAGLSGSDQRFLPGQRLPAAIAIGEDVSKSDAGHDLTRRVDQRGESAGISEVAFNKCAELREVVYARLLVWNVIERLTASLQRAVRACVFKFVGQHAGDGVSILAAEGRGPVLFECRECGRGLWLILGAIGGECGERERER